MFCSAEPAGAILPYGEVEDCRGVQAPIRMQIAVDTDNVTYVALAITAAGRASIDG